MNARLLNSTAMIFCLPFWHRSVHQTAAAFNRLTQKPVTPDADSGIFPSTEAFGRAEKCGRYTAMSSLMDNSLLIIRLMTRF
jgi:hypothetical protein